MTTVLVTGATGFIGSHVAHLLAERGDDVVLGVEEGSPGDAIADLELKRLRLEVRDRRSVRRALKGIERVFHCAGVTSARPEDTDRLFDVNVGGTKLLMEECLRAEVERVVYTSSAAVVGPAPHGGAADEGQLFTAGRLGIPYVTSVHEAEVEAMRVAAQGLPLVCVNPAVCFGAGDYLSAPPGSCAPSCSAASPSTPTARPRSSTCATSARAHLLADERGRVGERYILGGRNFTFERLFADLGRVSGIDPPVKLPAAAARAAAAVLEASGRSWPLTQAEVRAAGHWWTYRSTKARRELGWRPRPHEETLEATVAWHAEREHDRIARTRRSQPMQLRVAGAAVGVAGSAVGLLRRIPIPRP